MPASPRTFRPQRSSKQRSGGARADSWTRCVTRTCRRRTICSSSSTSSRSCSGSSRAARVEGARGEAVEFVKLLLEASEQTDVPVYIVLTMRSDFIGDCMEYPGSARSLNKGQYLVPRMTRDELRAAITGPVAVAGAAIAPRLVQRLLNDMGETRISSRVLQHALMRTWDHWVAARRAARRRSTSTTTRRSAGCARRFRGTPKRPSPEPAPAGSSSSSSACFAALTDIVTDPRGVRRPMFDGGDRRRWPKCRRARCRAPSSCSAAPADRS